MTYALLALAVLGLLTSTGFAAIVLWSVPGYLKERRLALAQMQARPGFTPPLTLIKPLHGYEPGLEANLGTFFQQDYRVGIEKAAQKAFVKVGRGAFDFGGDAGAAGLHTQRQRQGMQRT